MSESKQSFGKVQLWYCEECGTITFLPKKEKAPEECWWCVRDPETMPKTYRFSLNSWPGKTTEEGEEE